MRLSGSLAKSVSHGQLGDALQSSAPSASRAPGPTAPLLNRAVPHRDPLAGPGPGPEPTLQRRTLRPRGAGSWPSSLGHQPLSWWSCPGSCQSPQRHLPLAQRPTWHLGGSTQGPGGECPGKGTEREAATPNGHPDTSRLTGAKGHGLQVQTPSSPSVIEPWGLPVPGI